MKNMKEELDKSEKRIWIDVILPVTSLIFGGAAIAFLLGIDRLANAIVATNDDFKNAAASDLLIGEIIEFEPKILICMLICIVLCIVCKKYSSKRRKCATAGMVIAIVCMVISRTPLGNVSYMLPVIVQSFKNNVMGKGDNRLAKEEDYSVSDLHVTYDEDYLGFATACGTITNTTEYDWEYVNIKIELSDIDEEYEKAFLSCRIEHVLAGESVEFESNATPFFVPALCYEDCEITSVSYDIDSSTGNKDIWQ